MRFLCASSILFTALAVFSTSADSDVTAGAYKNETESLFRLVPPEQGFITILYDSPPMPCSVIMYADARADNFTISIESTKVDVATVSGDVTVGLCQVETNWTVTANSTVQYREYNVQNEICYNVTFSGRGEFLGYSNVRLFVEYNNKSEDISPNELYIGNVLLRVIRAPSVLSVIFNVVVIVVVVITTLAMGNGLDFQVIKEHLKVPKAPLIAMISQFTIMPLLSYAIIMAMGFTGGKALGFFVLGCSPGGGSSNMYSKLFNGDMSLSVTMTTLSTVLCLGMLPLWVYTLGSTIPSDTGVDKIQLPFVSIAMSLVYLIVPLMFGVLIRYKLPRLSRVLKKGLKVIFIVVILFFFTFGVYANLYMFLAWDGRTLLAACLLPYSGYVLGGLLAWACRFEWKLIKTIALETAMQNVGVATLIVKTISTQPESDLAIILPVASTIVTSWPLYLVLPGYLIRQRILNKRKAKLEADKDSNESAKLEVNDEGESSEQTGAEADAEEGSRSEHSESSSNRDVEMKLLNSP